MENSKYITLEQDIVSLGNRLKTLENLIDVEAFKQYGKFASSYTRAFKCFDQRRARTIVRRTIRNANRNLKTIEKKLIRNGANATSIDLIKSVMGLSIRLVKIQQLFM